MPSFKGTLQAGERKKRQGYTHASNVGDDAMRILLPRFEIGISLATCSRCVMRCIMRHFTHTHTQGFHFDSIQ
jgi:hypothetical protein